MALADTIPHLGKAHKSRFGFVLLQGGPSRWSWHAASSKVMVAAGTVVGTIVASNGSEDPAPCETETETLRDGFDIFEPIWLHAS